jgi:hypothetical protein
MASSKDIILRSGHGTPSTIILRDPVVADAAPVTTIKLFPGDATASTIVLRDPSASAAAGSHSIVGAGAITVSGAATMLEGRRIIGAGVIAIGGAATTAYVAAALPAESVIIAATTGGAGYVKTTSKRKRRPLDELLIEQDQRDIEELVEMLDLLLEAA